MGQTLPEAIWKKNAAPSRSPLMPNCPNHTTTLNAISPLYLNWLDSNFEHKTPQNSRVDIFTAKTEIWKSQTLILG